MLKEVSFEVAIALLIGCIISPELHLQGFPRDGGLPSGVAHPVGQPIRVRKDFVLRKLRLELGPDVLGALEDPEVVEILLNPDGSLWVEKRGEMARIGTMTAVNAKHLLGTIARLAQYGHQPRATALGR